MKEKITSQILEAKGYLEDILGIQIAAVGADLAHADGLSKFLCQSFICISPEGNTPGHPTLIKEHIHNLIAY